MLRAIFCLISILLLLACKDSSSNISARLETPENNQFVVYKAIITDSQFGIYYRTIAVEKYTKENHSQVSPNKEWLKKMLPALQDETLQDFKTKNVNPVQLRDNFDDKAEFVFIDENQDWSVKFPQGKIAFSNVGFNEQMNQALVYLDVINKKRTSSGTYLLLHKEGENWKVKQKFADWME